MKRFIALILFVLPPAGALAHGGTAGKVDYSKAEETAFGRAADPEKAQRTIRVEMSDQMRFSPAEITVKRGETVRFVPMNEGQVPHEMVLGTMDELKEHAALMRKFPNMEHDEPNMAHVAPGKSGEMGWRFTKAGTFYYGCLQPGHFEAGMVGKVIVTQAEAAGEQPAAPLSKGEIRKVDREAGKITIKHGPLENLGMPAMTMVFRVKDAAMLDQVKPGDKVSFEAEQVGGALTVVRIEPAR